MQVTVSEIVGRAYELFELTQLSVTGLLVVAALFTLALLFAAREAASWFFKIDDVKRDLRRLKDLTLSLEGEIRTLQNLLSQTTEPLKIVVPQEPQAKAAGEPKPAAFPIVH